MSELVQPPEAAQPLPPSTTSFSAPLTATTAIPSAAPAPVALPPSQGLSIPPTAPVDQSGRSLRKRAAANASIANSSHQQTSAADRTTRSGTSFANRPRWMPKLKLKVNEGSDGRKQSFLGPYDRDLDSEDDELVFEEQFVLRMPPGKECDRLRELVSKRGSSSDIWFKFKDPRRAVFHVGETLHSAKLVDLPCIIESQKTLDNKHMFKVADICQMLVVEDSTLATEDALLSNKKAFNANEFIWPHGITPPLQHVRKRRFRKRLNRQAIETVENEVDRLLQEEKHANVQEYFDLPSSVPVLFEDEDPDLSDSEYLRRVMPPQSPDEGEFNNGEVKEENDDDAFAAAIEQALQQGSDEDNDDDDEDESGEEGMDDGDDGDEDGASDSGSASGSASGSDDDEDDEEYSGAKKLLDDEIKQLEVAIAKKNEDIAKVTNVALKTRFINAVAKMSADLEGKLAHRDQLLAEHRAQRERDQEEGDDSVEEDDEAAEDMFGETMDIA